MSMGQILKPTIHGRAMYVAGMTVPKVNLKDQMRDFEEVL